MSQAVRAVQSRAFRPSPQAVNSVTPAASSESVNPFLCLALYVFVASIPFESPIRILPYDVPTLVGALFLASTILSPRLVWGRVPAPVWWFFAFMWVYGLSFALGGAQYPGEVRKQFIALFQLVLTFWATCNLLRRQEIAERALMVFVCACVVLAVMQLAGIAERVGDFEGGIRRAHVLGQNPNRTARILSVGVLSIIGLTLLRSPSILRSRMLGLVIAALLGAAMLKGGSRGALLSLAAGVWMFSVGGRSFGVKFRNALLSVLVIGGGVFAALQSPLMRARLELAGSGNLAKREAIFPTAVQMFTERPLLGWGPISNQYEVAVRLPQEQTVTRDTHNLVLELTTSTGILGALLFLLGITACAMGAWRGRHGPHASLAVAMVVALLVGNMSGNLMQFKPYWLILAYATAAGSLILRPGWRHLSAEPR